MREWTAPLGRNGELLAITMYRQFGLATLDIAAAAIRGAPLIKTWQHSIISPDGLLVGRAALLHEIKTKTQADVSRGGPRETDWIPRGEKFHGIDKNNFLGYLHAQKMLRLPLLLSIINIRDGLLLAATLQQLGDPYPSLLPQLHDMINWPQRHFKTLWEFDPRRLALYFREPPENKTEKRMRQFVEWLRPRQLEFAEFRQDLIDQLQYTWSR